MRWLLLSLPFTHTLFYQRFTPHGPPVDCGGWRDYRAVYYGREILFGYVGLSAAVWRYCCIGSDVTPAYNSQ